MVQYSEEELIAEMGSAFLCNVAKIEVDVTNSASYLDGWMKYVCANPKALVHSAGKAQKAVDYILGNNSKDGVE